MKKILTLFAMLLVTASTLLAQTPKLSYQMVVRNNEAQKVGKFNQKDLVYSTQLTGNINILVATNGNYAPAASGNFTATTNMNGMLSLTIVGSDDQTQGNGIVKLDKKLRDINWNQAKIVVGISTYGINDTMPVYPVPYALSALNHDSTLSTKAIYYYISKSTVEDVDTIYKTIMANNELHEAIDSAIVFYIKNNRTAVKNLIFHFLGQLNTDDLNEAYAEYKKNKQLDSALVDTVTKYIINHYDLAKEIALSYARTADVNDAKTFLNAIDGMDQNNVYQIADTLVGAACKYVKDHPEKLKKAFTKILTTQGLVTPARLQYALDYLQGQIDGKTTNTRLYDTMLTFLNDSIIQKYLDENHYLKNCTTNENEVNICDLLARVQTLENNPTFVKCPDLGKPVITPNNQQTPTAYTLSSTIKNAPANLDLTVSQDSVYFLLSFLYTGKEIDTMHLPATLNLTQGNDSTMTATLNVTDALKNRSRIIEVKAILFTRCTPLSAQISAPDTIKILPLECPNVIAITGTDTSATTLQTNKGILLTGKIDHIYKEKIDTTGFLIQYNDFDGTEVKAKTDTLYAKAAVANDATYKATLTMDYCSKVVKVIGFVKCKEADAFNIGKDTTFHVRGPELEIVSSVADNIYRAFADSIELTAKDSIYSSTHGWHDIAWFLDDAHYEYAAQAREQMGYPKYFWTLKGKNDTINRTQKYNIAPDSTVTYVAWMQMSYMNATCKVYDTLKITYKPYECADSVVANGAVLYGPKVSITPDNNGTHADTLCVGTKDTLTLSAKSVVTVKETGTDSTLAAMKANNAYNGLVDTFYYRWLEYGKSDVNTYLSDKESFKITVNRDSSFVCALAVKFKDSTLCWKYDTIDVKYQFVCSTDTIRDIQGNKYATINVNNVCWTKSNMRSTKNSKADKDIALGATGPDSEIMTITNGSAKYYNPSASLHNFTDVQLGLLYNQAAADSVCPKGWHLPTDAEWTELENYVDTLGGTQKHTYGPIEITIANTTIISEKTTLAKYLTGGTWILEPVSAPANKVGFDAYPAGARHTNTLIPRQDLWPFALASFWTSTQYQNTDKYFSRSIYGNNINPNDYILRDTANKILGFSVRCVYGEEETVSESCPTLGATTITWDVNNNIVVSTPINNYQEALVSNTNENKYIVSLVELGINSYSYTATGEVANGLLTATISRSQIESLAQTLQVPQGSYNIKVVPQIALAGECASEAAVVGTAATQEVVLDAQHHIYPTVTIGTQIWMKENLRYNPNFPTNPSTQEAPAIAYPAGNESNVTAYGLLYNYYAAITEGLCPAGWRMPTNDDFETLIQNVNNCSGSNSGAKALADGTQWWNSSDNECAPGNGVASNNSSGFSARPAGSFNQNDQVPYYPLGYTVWYWAKSTNTTYWYHWSIQHSNELFVREVVNDPEVFNVDYMMANYVSIRCIKAQN